MSKKDDFERFQFRVFKILGVGWILFVLGIGYLAFRPKPQPPGGTAIG